MGEVGQSLRHQVGGQSLSTAARVVPSVATFAVDEGFWYAIPEGMLDRVGVGSIVRVPLSGRKVRGYVVERRDRDPSGLKEIVTISSELPVFDPTSLRTLAWAAGHYVAPMAAILDRTAPPNLPRPRHYEPHPDLAAIEGTGPLHEMAVGTKSGRSSTPLAMVTSPEPSGWLADITPVLETGRTVMIIVATAAEAAVLLESARRSFGSRAIIATGSDREVTSAWVSARQPGSILIGTPRLAMWTIPSLGLCVVVEEGRRAMKDRQTPTLHVRDLMLKRSESEPFSLAFVGPTPSVELLASGARVVRPAGRAWSLIEVVDRSGDPPGAGYLSDRALADLRGAISNGWDTLLFTHRRIGDESLRCTQCRAVRLCARCGSRLGREEQCRRCGSISESCRHCGGTEFESMGTIPERLQASLRRSFGNDSVAIAPDSGPITIGTERDLAGLDGFDLIVVADGDGLAFGHDYRSSEEALRILGRLGNLVRTGTGRRLMIQTSMPQSRLMATMRSGDPVPYLEAVLADRIKSRLPPVVEMLALEVRGELDDDPLAGELDETDVVVMGPAFTSGGARWLIQGDLMMARPIIRQLVRRWRDRGLAVRVDADPIDL